MAKRFTDTAIWDKAWFRKLTPTMKEAWRYLCDQCDHAGIWDIDFEAMSFMVNDKISEPDVRRFLGDRVRFLDDNKLFVIGFIEFQYKCTVDNLNPENKVHKSVLDRIEKVGAFKPLTSPLLAPCENHQGAKDKDKDKDKELDREKDQEKEKVTHQKFDFDSVADQYPRPTDRPKGIDRMRKYITTQSDYSDLVKAVNNYATHIEVKGTEMNFVKHLASFIGSKQKGHPWRYWIKPDPRELEADGQNPKIRPIKKYSANDEHLAKLAELRKKHQEREVGQ